MKPWQWPTSAGDRLLAFEIGNEPDLFPGVHRPANYSYADYYAEYRRFKKAIRDKLPNAPFAGPDVIVRADWLEQFAATEAADLEVAHLSFLCRRPAGQSGQHHRNSDEAEARFCRGCWAVSKPRRGRRICPIGFAKPIPVLEAASRASATPWRRRFGVWISCLRWRNSTRRESTWKPA